MPGTSKSVLLFGDAIKDRYLLPLSNKGHKNEDRDWKNHRQWKEYPKEGGVDLLRDMLEGCGLEVVKTVKPKVTSLQSLAILGACKMKDGFPTKFTGVDTSDKAEKCFLRVQRDLGYHDTGEEAKPTRVPRRVPRFDLLAISDAGNDFRQDEALCGYLKDAMEKSDKPIVLKTHLPLGKGGVWHAFSEAKDKKRIVIIQSDDLREEGATIRRGVPWDRVIEDLQECRAREPLAGFLQEGINVIVLFGVEGAALFETDNQGGHSLQFICDPACAEGQVAAELPGAMVGYLSAFMAALIAEMLKAPGGEQPKQVKEAMSTMRAFAGAHWKEGSDAQKLQLEELSVLRKRLTEWTKENEAKSRTPHYIIARPQRHERVNLLRDVLRDVPHDETHGDMAQTCLGLARDIINEGARAHLKGFPHAEFGDLITLDVAEIEALRGIGRLIEDYNDDPARAKPISFAVFGPPGAGKSFGVKQLVDKRVNPVEEFNLSQATESDLPLFFQKIRDQNLRGKTPLCFFDEFDSGDRQLLKFFLAPMQDGEYREGDAIRPIGRGIFVFAGGTVARFEEFAGLGQMTEKDRKAFDAEARRTKSPDFISRLSGYLNVTGVKAEADPDAPIDPEADLVRLLHRAILIRSMLERYMGDLVPDNASSALTDELIDWLLREWEPTHGARSIETVIRGIAANKRTTKIGLSDLPMDTLNTIHTSSR
ncbi:MAG: hypothetical protein AAGI03_13895 [Pseudomonadota bacterium]